MLSLNGDRLNEKEKQRVTGLPQEWNQFLLRTRMTGHTNAVLHWIPTGDAPPVCEGTDQYPLAFTLNYGHCYRACWPLGWCRKVPALGLRQWYWRGRRMALGVLRRPPEAELGDSQICFPAVKDRGVCYKPQGIAWYSTLDMARGY